MGVGKRKGRGVCWSKKRPTQPGASQGLVAMRQSATSQCQPDSHRGEGKRLAKGKLPHHMGEELLYFDSSRMMRSLSESTCKAHTFISKRDLSQRCRVLSLEHLWSQFTLPGECHTTLFITWIRKYLLSIYYVP